MKKCWNLKNPNNKGRYTSEESLLITILVGGLLRFLEELVLQNGSVNTNIGKIMKVE